MSSSAHAPLVVAIDAGYTAYDQEIELIGAAGARFEVRPVHGNEVRACEVVGDADVILVRESPVSRRVIEAAPHCRGIVRYGIGVDNIDLLAAREQSVPVANVPDYGIDEVWRM